MAGMAHRGRAQVFAKAGGVLVAALAILWYAPFAASQVVFPDRPPLESPDRPALQYWSENRQEPRPLRIHVLQVDLAAANHEVIVMTGEDPDGAGPAEASLEDPLRLAARFGAVAAVNANFFSFLTGQDGEQSAGWRAGNPVDILGWVVSEGRQLSHPRRRFTNLWFAGGGRGAIGASGPVEAVSQAVAGFETLLTEGRVRVTKGGEHHPRSAAGLDAQGQRLWLVVVDGRQREFSEGMSTHELALFMLELGCRDAVNLDGGGSSVMVVRQPDGRLWIANSPSDGTPRPLPVMLGVRPRRTSD